MNLLKHPHNSLSVNWLEDDHQAAVVQAARRHPLYNSHFIIVGDQNAGKRSRADSARRKVCGMTAGEPDLRIYIKPGKLLFIEMKRWGGRLSAVQVKHHAILSGLGFKVVTITQRTPADSVLCFLGVLGAELGC